MDVSFEDYQAIAGIDPVFDTSNFSYTSSVELPPTNISSFPETVFDHEFASVGGFSSWLDTWLIEQPPSFLSIGGIELPPSSLIIGSEGNNNQIGSEVNDPLTDPFNTPDQPPVFERPIASISGEIPVPDLGDMDPLRRLPRDTNDEVENTNSPFGLINNAWNWLGGQISSLNIDLPPIETIEEVTTDFLDSLMSGFSALRDSSWFNFNNQPTETIEEETTPFDAPVSYTPNQFHGLDNPIAMPKEIGSQNC